MHDVVWETMTRNAESRILLKSLRAGTYVGEGVRDEVERLVEILALASVGRSTQKVYWNQQKT